MIYLWTDPVHASALAEALREQWRALVYERPPLAPTFSRERDTIVAPCLTVLDAAFRALPDLAERMPWPILMMPDHPRFRAIVELEETGRELTLSLRQIDPEQARSLAGAGAFRGRPS